MYCDASGSASGSWNDAGGEELGNSEREDVYIIISITSFTSFTSNYIVIASVTPSRLGR